MGYFENLLTLDLADYDAVSFPIGIVLLCIFIGMIAATVVVQCTNRWIYRTAKALLRHKAESEENAKTIKELGLFEEKGILRAIRRENAMLMRFLCRAEKKEAKEGSELSADAESMPDAPIGEERYYLNPAMADKAKEILCASETTVLQTVLYCLLFVAIYFALASALPLALSVIL